MVEKKKKDPIMEAVKKSKKGSRAERIGAIAVGATKKYGHNVIHKASESEALVVPRVSTGLYGLDAKTNGGWPLRRVSMVYGLQSTWKTSGYLRGLGNAQRLCANCLKPGTFKEGTIELPDFEKGGIKKVKTQVITDCPCGDPSDYLAIWIDAEGVWEPKWSKRMGVWAEKVMLMRPSYGEQAYDVAVGMVDSGAVDHITIDSLAAMTPKAEIVDSMEQQLQGVAARVNNKFIRKIVSAMNHCFQRDGRTPTVWLVNQYRQKIGVMFGPSETVPGGMGQKFATSLEVEFRKGKLNIDEETGEVYDGLFKFTVKKNKVGTEGGKGEFKMCKAETDFSEVGDLLEHAEVIKAATDMELIQRPSTVTYEFNGQKFRGVGAMELYLLENVEEYEALKTKMLRYRLGIEDEA